uniref:Uncharacterized protein n=1 Tax=Oryza glumipatula TaxID=40148 RepID=A0A0E0BNT6_9ORYZ
MTKQQEHEEFLERFVQQTLHWLGSKYLQVITASTDPIIDVTHGIAKYPINSIAIFPLLGSLKQRAGGFGDQRKPAHSGSPLPGCTMLLRTGLNRPTFTSAMGCTPGN